MRAGGGIEAEADGAPSDAGAPDVGRFVDLWCGSEVSR